MQIAIGTSQGPQIPDRLVRTIVLIIERYSTIYKRHSTNSPVAGEVPEYVHRASDGALIGGLVVKHITRKSRDAMHKLCGRCPISIASVEY